MADDVQNITVEILKQIRDETKRTREELGERIDAVRIDLGARIDQTNVRLDQTNARLDKVEETLVELATQSAFLVKRAKKRRVNDIEGRLPPKEN